jgi:uncharacterized protein (DUF58 family)
MTEAAARRANAESLLAPEFLARLERLEPAVRKLLSGEMRGDHAVRRRGGGSLFREHKPYVQGDDLRFVDWNVFSRLGELVVKNFDADEALKMNVFVDATGSMNFGRSNKFLFARRLAAALGFITLNRLGVVAIEELSERRREASSAEFFGRKDVAALLAHLDAMPVGGDVDLFEAVRASLGRRGGRGLAVVVTDGFAERGYARALQFLRHTGFKTAVVHVLDHDDFRPPLAGSLQLEDVENRRTLRASFSADLLDRYASEVRLWCDGVEAFCHGHDIAYARVDTAKNVEETVLGIFVRRGILR